MYWLNYICVWYLYKSFLSFSFFHSTGEDKCDFSNSCATPSLCKGYLTSCQSVTKGFYVSSSIAANFSEVQEYEEGFKKNVSQIITNITKIHCVANVSLSSGSIHVSFILVPEKGQTLEDFQKALALLQSVIESGNFILSLPSGLQLTFSAGSLVIRPVTPATTSTSTTTPSSTETAKESKKNLTVIIVCSVVFGVLFFVIIAVLVFLSLRKKKQDGRISPSQSQNFKGAEQPSVEMGARGHYNKKDHPGELHEKLIRSGSYLWQRLSVGEVEEIQSLARLTMGCLGCFRENTSPMCSHFQATLTLMG